MTRDIIRRPLHRYYVASAIKPNLAGASRRARRQGMEYDAGLLFVCYQRDPRTDFIKIFDKMARFDMLSQFVTHTGGGLFACPRGMAQGEFVGQRLFDDRGAGAATVIRAADGTVGARSAMGEPAPARVRRRPG